MSIWIPTYSASGSINGRANLSQITSMYALASGGYKAVADLSGGTTAFLSDALANEAAAVDYIEDLLGNLPSDSVQVTVENTTILT